MNKLRLVFPIALLAVFASLTNCSNNNKNTILSSKFYELVNTANKSHGNHINFRLDSITSFAWDSVYFFHGEENTAFIDAMTNTNWNGPPVPNLNTRFLFTNNRQVVAYFDCAYEGPNGEYNKFPFLKIGILTCPDSGVRNRHRVLARSDAKLAIRKVCNRPDCGFMLIPLRCIDFFDFEEK